MRSPLYFLFFPQVAATRFDATHVPASERFKSFGKTKHGEGKRVGDQRSGSGGLPIKRGDSSS